MSCAKCPPKSKHHDGSSASSSRGWRLISAVLPECSALLSTSCCWLPMLLDFVFAGSVTAAGISNMRHVFSAISILTLVWSISQDGFSRRNTGRAIICAGLVAWAQYNRSRQPVEGHHGCH